MEHGGKKEGKIEQKRKITLTNLKFEDNNTWRLTETEKPIIKSANLVWKTDKKTKNYVVIELKKDGILMPNVLNN